MKDDIAHALLWLFVLNLGIAYGAGLYEKRIVLPQWFSRSADSSLRVDAAAMRRTNTGLRFWAYVTTVPLTLLTLANLAAASQSQGPGRGWWLAAAGVTLVERIGTFSYFIPAAIRLMRSDDLPAAVAGTMAQRWVRLNYLRDALGLAGWLAALKALSMPA